MKKEYLKKRLIDYCRSREYEFYLYSTGVVEINIPSHRLFPSLSSAYKAVFIDGNLAERMFVEEYDYKGAKLPFQYSEYASQTVNATSFHS